MIALKPLLCAGVLAISLSGVRVNGGTQTAARVMTPVDGDEPFPGDPPALGDCIMASLCSKFPALVTVSEIQAARDFRDNVLVKSPMGCKIISLYYEHSSELASKAMLDADFRANLVQSLNRLVPMVNRAEVQIQNAKNQGIVPQVDLSPLQTDVDAVDSMLDFLNQNGSLSLQQDVASFRSEIGPMRNFVGVQLNVSLTGIKNIQ